MAEIKDFLSPEAIKQQDDYIKKLSVIKTGYEATAKASMQLLTNIEKIQVSTKTTGEAQKKLNKTTSEAAKLQKQYETNTEKLRIVQGNYSKAVIRTRMEMQEQTKEIKRTITINKSAEGSYNKLNAEMNKNIDRWKKLSAAERENANIGGKLLKTIQSQDAQLKKLDAGMGRHQRNVGNYSDALGGLSPGFARASAGASKLNQMFKLLLANPVVLVVSAIVAVFAGLVAIFKSTDDGGTKLQGVFDGISNVLGVLKNALSQVLDAFLLIRQGKFREAFRAIGDAAKFAADNVTEAYKAGALYAQQLDELNDRITANISAQAETLRQFREYISLSKDQTLTDQERVENLELAQKAAENYFGTLKQDAKEAFDLEVANLASRTKLTADQLSEFIALDGKRAEEARKTNEDIANAWNVLGDDNIKTLEEMYAKMIEADTQYFKRTNEITSLRTGIIKRQNNERIKSEQERINSLIEAELSANDEIIELDEDLLNEKEDNLDAEIDANIKANNKIIEDAKRRKKTEEGLEKDLLNVKKQLALDSVNAIFDINQAANERKLEQLEEEKQNILSNENLTSEEREKIEADFALKEQEIQKRQKVANKIQSAVDVGISTAQSIFEIKAAAAVLLSNPFTAALAPIALAQIPFVLGSSALALASIAAFKDGTDNAPRTGLFGEAGGELMKTKSGDYYYADKPTVFSGTQFEHAKIWNANETNSILSDGIVKGRNIDELINIKLTQSYERGFAQMANEYKRGNKQVVRAIKDGNRSGSYNNTLETRSGNTIKRYHNQFN